MAAALLLASAIMLSPSAAYAADEYVGADGNTYYYGQYGNQIAIYGGIITNGDMVLPEEIDGLPVAIIWQSAFKGLSQVTSVEIPSTMLYVSFHAFKNCSNLTSVVSYGSFSMDKHAFGFCGNLTSFQFYGDMSNLSFQNGDTYLSSAFEESRYVAFQTVYDSSVLKNYVDAVNTTAQTASLEYHLTYNGIETDMGGETEPEPGEEESGGQNPSEDTPGDNQGATESDETESPETEDKTPSEADDASGAQGTRGTGDTATSQPDKRRISGQAYHQESSGDEQVTLSTADNASNAGELQNISRDEGSYFVVRLASRTDVSTEGSGGEQNEAAQSNSSSSQLVYYLESLTKLLPAFLMLVFFGGLAFRAAAFKRSISKPVRIP